VYCGDEVCSPKCVTKITADLPASFAGYPLLERRHDS
jgi:hypothetical protein